MSNKPTFRVIIPDGVIAVWKNENSVGLMYTDASSQSRRFFVRDVEEGWPEWLPKFNIKKLRKLAEQHNIVWADAQTSVPTYTL